MTFSSNRLLSNLGSRRCAKSIMDLNPLEIIVIMMSGKSAGGSFIAATCDELVADEKDIKEGFENRVVYNKVLKTVHILFVLG